MAIPSLPKFNLSPGAVSGRTATGQIPGQISAPQSTYQQVGNVLPSLPNLTQSAGQDVQGQLAGQLSPGTVNFLQDKAAQYGVSMGMPGVTPGGFGGNQFLRNLGMSSEGQVQAGLGNYNKLLPTLASTQIDPSLQFEVAQQNSLNAAAPDPALAAAKQKQDYYDAYNLENPSGGNSINEPGGAGFKPASAVPAWQKWRT